MADGSFGALTREDMALILELVRERGRLQREATQLSDTNIARKFGVTRSEVVKLRHGVAWTRSNPGFNVLPREGTHLSRILGVLREGPATAAEIAVSLGLGTRNTVSLLHGLQDRGLVSSRQFHDAENQTHPSVRLYSLAGAP